MISGRMASGPLGTRARIEGICTFIFKESAHYCYFSSTISAYFVWMVLIDTGDIFAWSI